MCSVERTFPSQPHLFVYMLTSRNSAGSPTNWRRLDFASKDQKTAAVGMINHDKNMITTTLREIKKASGRNVKIVTIVTEIEVTTFINDSIIETTKIYERESSITDIQDEEAYH